MLQYKYDAIEEESENAIDQPDLENLEEKNKSLIDLLNNYAKKTKNAYVISDEKVLNFRMISGEIFCKVQCPNCGVHTPCSYLSGWRVSNFYSHVRSCAKKSENRENPNDSTIETTKTGHTDVLQRLNSLPKNISR